ncbi:MAG: VTT domain-containing protein [Pseudomonadota bacterium]
MTTRFNPLQSKHVLRILLFITILVAIGAVFYFDMPQYLTLENVKRLQESLGWWALLVFVVAFVLGELLQVPSVLWIFFAGVIWPVWIALPISLLAAMLAASGAFIVARYFLGDSFHQKLPARFQNLNAQLEASPIRAIIFIRLTTFLHPLLHWVLAASSIKLPAFLVGTFVGILPATIALVLLGQQFLDWWEQYSLQITLLSVGLIALVIFLRRRKASSNTESTSE